MNILIPRHSVRSYNVDHFGAQFERRSEDAGAQFVLSCQRRQLCDGFPQLHGQAANFEVKMRVQVVTPRNRAEVLLFVFVARYLLCCGDIELNPGPFEKETDKHTTQATQQETSTTNGDKARVDPQTVSRHTDKISMQSVPTNIDQDMGLWILEAIQRQNEKFQSLQISMNLMRDDMGAVKTDISQVRIKCEEIGRTCDRIEKEHSELSTKLQVNKSDIDELFYTNEKNKNKTKKQRRNGEDLIGGTRNRGRNCKVEVGG